MIRIGSEEVGLGACVVGALDVGETVVDGAGCRVSFVFAVVTFGRRVGDFVAAVELNGATTTARPSVAAAMDTPREKRRVGSFVVCIVLRSISEACVRTSCTVKTSCFKRLTGLAADRAAWALRSLCLVSTDR